MKKTNPVVKIPKNIVNMAKLGSRTGKTDRRFLRMMAGAIADANRHKNESMRKLNRETSDVEN